MAAVFECTIPWNMKPVVMNDLPVFRFGCLNFYRL
jgi:hypothetical protein